jgi:hypothetical protein
MRIPSALEMRIVTVRNVARNVAMHGFCITRDNYFYLVGIFDDINAGFNGFFTPVTL